MNEGRSSKLQSLYYNNNNGPSNKKNQGYHSRLLTPRSAEIERLRAQLNQEEQLREAIEQSYNQLLNTSKELEKRMNMIDEESNEWKTRFENQEEINRQLGKQEVLLENKLEELKRRVKHMKRAYDNEIKDLTPDYMEDLERVKESLLDQLKDYGWRLEQENKAYHRANEERKDLTAELNESRNALNSIKEVKDLQMSNGFSNNNNNINQSIMSSRNNIQSSNYNPNIYYQQRSTYYLPSINTSQNINSNNNSNNSSMPDSAIETSRMRNNITRASDYNSVKSIKALNLENNRNRNKSSIKTLPKLKS